MRERIAELARRMREGRESLRAQAESYRKTDPSLVMCVSGAPLPRTVCAVDGGLLAGRMHGVDIVVARAAAAVFTYDGSRLCSSSCLPSPHPRPEVEMESSLEEHEALAFRSLVRIRRELECALFALESASPEVMLIDGSLLPLPADRPALESRLRGMYDGALKLYSRLYDECARRGCLLCGVIKDSRSRKLSGALGAQCSDSVLCGYLLRGSERTRDMGYFEGKAPSPELEALGSRIRVFYLRPSEKDIPLRVEVLGDCAGRAASVIYALSSICERFAYPAVLIEADMRAALDPSELEPIESSLAALSGLQPLRRNSRPFR